MTPYSTMLVALIKFQELVSFCALFLSIQRGVDRPKSALGCPGRACWGWGCQLGLFYWRTEFGIKLCMTAVVFFAGHHSPELAVGVVKQMYPKWNPGKWKHGLQSAVLWWLNFDPYPIQLFRSGCLQQLADVHLWIRDSPESAR